MLHAISAINMGFKCLFFYWLTVDWENMNPNEENEPLYKL